MAGTIVDRRKRSNVWRSPRLGCRQLGNARLLARHGRAAILGLGGRRFYNYIASFAYFNSIAASGLFDRDWYVENNSDVRAAGIDPLLHYLRHGAAEGRDPNPLFDSDWYLDRYPDVRAAGANPLVHYLRHGAAEGRDPSPLFQSGWYLDRHPGLRGADVSPLAHYLRHRFLNRTPDVPTHPWRAAIEVPHPQRSVTHSFARDSEFASRPSEGRSIAVLDDAFPQPLSAFRFEEFVSYLDALPKLQVFTDGRVFPLMGEARSVEEVIADHTRNYPRHSGRILPLRCAAPHEGAVAYTVFADNIHYYLDQIESRRMPFAFTLYAGGGFRLDQPEADERLARVFGSPWFRRVIATEWITRDYLLAKKLCPPERIVYILGGVIVRSAFDPPPPKPRFGFAKGAIDICFVAGRYMPNGADKGYDLFVAAARELCAAGIDARFHVVGNFDQSVLDLGAAASRFTFYGLRRTEFFREFYRHMDIMLAPTRPFVRRAGVFDSFPTAACVEAGLQEVAVVCSDELKLNLSFDDGMDVVVVRPVLADITERLMHLIADPGRIAAIGESGRKRMTEIFGPEVQVTPRIEMLRWLASE